MRELKESRTKCRRRPNVYVICGERQERKLAISAIIKVGGEGGWSSASAKKVEETEKRVFGSDPLLTT